MTDVRLPYHLIVFFTYGVSLKEWNEKGLISRELILYKKMVRSGNKVTLITYGGKDAGKQLDQPEGLNIISVYNLLEQSKNRWINLLKSFFIPFKFGKIIRSGDFLKSNQMSGAWVPLMGSFLYGKPFIVRCGFEMLRNLLRDEKRKIIWGVKAFLGYLFELAAYTLSNRIILSNDSDFHFVNKIFPVNAGKIKLIRNFIDTDHFSPKDFKKEQEGIKKILFIGRLEECKNIENLIKGVVSGGFRLDIIGNGVQTNRLKSIAKMQNGKINFLGTVDNRNLPDIIGNYDLFVLPSFYECSPKTLLEAMACQQVVLGTDVNGIKELIEDNKTGFLCNIDAVSIEKAITHIFNTDSEKLRMISKHAREFVIRECAIDTVYKQETGIYEQGKL